MTNKQVAMVVALCIISGIIGFAMGLLALPYWMRVSGF
jgi:hypothetical protein